MRVNKVLKFLAIVLLILVIFGSIFLISIGNSFIDFPGQLSIKILTALYVPHYPTSKSWNLESDERFEGELGPVNVYGGIIDFATEDNATTVVTFYKNKLTNDGWRITDEISGQEGVYQVKFRKEIFNKYSLGITVTACNFEKSVDFTKFRQSLERITHQPVIVNLINSKCTHKSIEIGG